MRFFYELLVSFNESYDAIDCVHCPAIKNKIKNHAVEKVKKLWY